MVTLRTASREDCETALKWAQDPELKEYFRRYPPVCDWSLPEQTLAALGWCYVVVEDDKPVGLVQLLNSDSQAKSVEVGMMIDLNLCISRKEVSYQAYKQLTDYVFNYLNYNKICMKILSHRHKLRDRLSRDGWALEGTLRESCRFKGELHDELVLGLLKSEWKKETE